MNIIMDQNHIPVTNEQCDLRVDVLDHVLDDNISNTYNTASDMHNSNVNTEITNIQVMSYANASQNTSFPVFRNPVTSTFNQDTSQNWWTEQLQQILAYHENGARTLIIMRGVPGSGKTFLAKKILDSLYNIKHNYYDIHIFSTDDYFLQRGVYIFDKTRISAAHEWNKSRARKAMMEGVSPVIVDNTNVELWEMEYYVAEGVKNGYIIEVVEPNTPWAKKANQLFKKNSHNVPFASIRRMLDNLQSDLTGVDLVTKFGFNYSSFNKPPILRLIPQFSIQLTEESISDNFVETASVSNTNITKQIQKTHNENVQCTSTQREILSPTADCSEKLFVSEETPSLSNVSDAHVSDDNNHDQSSFENQIQKYFEEMDKVEKEWDNEGTWEDKSKTTSQKTESCYNYTAKPQRKSKFVRPETTEKLMFSDEVCQDWSRCSMFLPSWGENSNSKSQETITKPKIEKRSSSTCIEYGDTDISCSKNPLKIITAVPRNINEYHIAINNNKIPEQWMLDKSTSTYNNQILNVTFRCQNEEQHFIAFRKLFKKVPRSELREVFDNCCGDVNWAVDIALDGMASNQWSIIESNDNSDAEAEAQNDNLNLCQCLSTYNSIPDQHESSPPIIEENWNCVDNKPLPLPIKKGKKENNVSDTSVQLKRQIEQTVVISDSHYSDRCLKIRKMRRGESSNEVSENNFVCPDISNQNTTENLEQSISQSSTPSTSKIENDYTETCSDDYSAGPHNAENTVNITLGKEFIRQLDEHFGRSKVDYPSNLIPKINMPRSLLNEINALWMESLMDQMERDAKQSQIMLQQDEDFARQLAMKEAEMTQAGVKPKVPDFKEIMDMDFALSLYHKNVAEWRNDEPSDLAARLTREKLYNLFPEISPDILSEMLMAHGNDFYGTVEVLLMSMGKNEIISEENGISKFVMEKEMERQRKDNTNNVIDTESVSEQQQQLEPSEDAIRKAVADVEWPLLPKSEHVEMSVVQQYRDDADKHLQARNTNYQKAQDYIRRGMTQVATYYSDVAAYHTKKFELSNSMAAASLMQVNAANCSDNATIDLHYLRVGEAKESLDLFLDMHIQNLREKQDKSGVKCLTLYFITGRGLHSNGKPRIKPAVKKRLEERGLAFKESNPGLLNAKVCADDKLSYQIA